MQPIHSHVNMTLCLIHSHYTWSNSQIASSKTRRIPKLSWRLKMMDSGCRLHSSFLVISHPYLIHGTSTSPWMNLQVLTTPSQQQLRLISLVEIHVRPIQQGVQDTVAGRVTGLEKQGHNSVRMASAGGVVWRELGRQVIQVDPTTSARLYQ
jgi:hypothetical protein